MGLPPPAAPRCLLPLLIFTLVRDLQVILPFLHQPKTSQVFPASLNQGFMSFIPFQNLLQTVHLCQQEQVPPYCLLSQPVSPMLSYLRTRHVHLQLPEWVSQMKRVLSRLKVEGCKVMLPSFSIFRRTALFQVHFGKMKAVLLSSPLIPREAERLSRQETGRCLWIRKA